MKSGLPPWRLVDLHHQAPRSARRAGQNRAATRLSLAETSRRCTAIAMNGGYLGMSLTTSAGISVFGLSGGTNRSIAESRASGSTVPRRVRTRWL